jgi:hydroxymethylpyrimidine/phosphomethylpyrimidine kinase
MAGESCAAASGLGVDLKTFIPTVAYGIHFITLEDLR